MQEVYNDTEKWYEDMGTTRRKRDGENCSREPVHEEYVQRTVVMKR